MRVLIFALASALFAQLAHGATLSSYTSKEGKQIIILNGEITTGDLDQLQSLIKNANSAGRVVSGIRLNSPGGTLLEAVKIADLIRYGKIATVVPNGQTCASACFIIFAAGGEKYASYSASVGVHGASDKSGKESGDGTVAMAKIIKELGVPPAIIGKMVVTPPEQMVWLGPNDLRAIGTTMTGKPSQVPTSKSADTRPQQLAREVNTAAMPAPKKEWKDIFAAAMDKSATQHNGRPNVTRACQPEFKICSTALHLKGNDGADMMLRMAEDMNGKLISRDICKFNAFGDIRTCIDWDTGATSRDMKDPKGNWTQVGDK